MMLLLSAERRSPIRKSQMREMKIAMLLDLGSRRLRIVLALVEENDLVTRQQTWSYDYYER